jgi:hypothetical protein
MNIQTLAASRQPGDPLPVRLQLFKLGENLSNQGPFIVDDQSIAELAANQRLIGRERVPIGFEHNIDEGSAEYLNTKEPRPIAGMGTVEAVPGKGIFLTAIGWNKVGADTIDHYEDLSPTPIFDKKTRRVLGIASASLTRTGSVYGLTLENAEAAALTSIMPWPFPARPRADSLTGISRTVAAFERQNARNKIVASRLAAKAVRNPIDPTLQGMARVLAVFEQANAGGEEV